MRHSLVLTTTPRGTNFYLGGVNEEIKLYKVKIWYVLIQHCFGDSSMTCEAVSFVHLDCCVVFHFRNMLQFNLLLLVDI